MLMLSKVFGTCQPEGRWPVLMCYWYSERSMAKELPGAKGSKKQTIVYLQADNQQGNHHQQDERPVLPTKLI